MQTVYNCPLLSLNVWVVKCNCYCSLYSTKVLVSLVLLLLLLWCILALDQSCKRFSSLWVVAIHIVFYEHWGRYLFAHKGGCCGSVKNTILADRPINSRLRLRQKSLSIESRYFFKECNPRVYYLNYFYVLKTYHRGAKESSIHDYFETIHHKPCSSVKLKSS